MTTKYPKVGMESHLEVAAKPVSCSVEVLCSNSPEGWMDVRLCVGRSPPALPGAQPAIPLCSCLLTAGHGGIALKHFLEIYPLGYGIQT